MKHSLTVTAWLAALVTAAGCGGSDRPETNATGTIAFERAGEVWLMAADGSGQRRLTRGSLPDWSPDGRRIAFSADRPYYRSEILVVDADGRRRLRLTRAKYDFDQHSSPDWSPDGQAIAFQGYNDGDYWISIVGADGTGQRRLTSEYPPEDAGPAWSPDGRTIVFRNVHDGAAYVMRPDGSGRHVLATIGGAERTWGVEWSPDGRRIAVVADDDLWVMNADGTEHRRLVDDPGEGTGDIAWSPDGRRVAFTSGETREDSEIFVVNAHGSDLRQLTNNDDGANGDPSWSPDGRAIAFTSDRDGNSEIYVMDADGSDQRNVSQNRAEEYGPAWSPVG